MIPEYSGGRLRRVVDGTATFTSNPGVVKRMLKQTLPAVMAVGTIIAASASSAHAALAYALTDMNTLIGFDTGSPSMSTSAVILKSTSNTAIEDLIGIDYRPSNSTLYGVGRFGSIYTINPTTGVSTVASTLSVSLIGSRFGFDFNPVADRLRITSDSDQNLRVNVDTGAATVDGTLNPGNPTVTASAYTNSVAPTPTATTLYDIDSVTDSLYVQAPPNDGTLVLVGQLGIDIASINGFDIYTAPGGTNMAFAALLETGRSVSSLYSINLTTGFATPLGKIGGGDVIDGLAIVPTAVPEPTTLAAVAGVGLVALVAGAVAALTSPPSLLSFLDGLVGGGRGTHRTGDGVPFGTQGQRLDVWQPSGGPRRGLPVVIFWYGGGWAHGSRDAYAFAGRAFARRGFVAIVPDYRKVPQVRFPAFIQDGAEAVRWARDHVAEYGGDPDRIALAGHSAGAYTVAMLTLDRRWLRAEGVDPGVVKAAVGLCGPYDFYPFTVERAAAAMRGVADPQMTQPIHFARGDAAPMLLVSAGNDVQVRAHNAVNLTARIAAVGGRVVHEDYPSLSHENVVMALSKPFRGEGPVLDHVVAFLNREMPPRSR